MAKEAITCICIFISLSIISAAGINKRSSQEGRKRTETGLVSNLFSELGNLFLDIDETLAIQTAPKIELEGLMAQLLKPSNEYFSNVQENYRTLQKKLGSLLHESSTLKGTHTDRDTSTVQPRKHEVGVEQDSSSQEAFAKTDLSKTTEAEMKGSSKSTVSLDSILNSECSKDILSNPLLDLDRLKACSQKVNNVNTNDGLKRPMGRKGIESRLKNQLHVPFNPDETESYQYGFFRRGGDVAESTPKHQGRILGDTLYSESLFDRNLRQLLRDHGKWILDNPLLIRWRKGTSKDNSGVTIKGPTTETETTTQSSSETTPEIESTQAYVPITEEYDSETPRPVSQETYSENRLPLKSASYYRLNNGVVGEEVELMLNPDLNHETVRIVETDSKLKPSPVESVILAFTLDGIPLKLRIGPEIENPSRFLHKILKSAGVSLNIPVESYDDIKPVGKEILTFGAGVSARPTYYDLSNRDDLKTLLKALMKSKASGKI